MTEFLNTEFKEFQQNFQQFLNENINLPVSEMRAKSLDKGFYSISHQSSSYHQE